jgi:hypothetical protein
VDDYFARCRLAAFDPRAVAALNRQEQDYLAVAAKDMSITAEEVKDFPLARVDKGRVLPLTDGLNPAWADAVAALRSAVITPLLGEKTALNEAEWLGLSATFGAYNAWAGSVGGAAVEPIGLGRVRDILASNARQAISALIAKDNALEAEFNALTSVEKLVRYNRDLYALIKNFVSFIDFYTHKKAVFQAGTLYLDARHCDLCVKVADTEKHSLLAPLSGVYLAYCDCARRGGTEKMTVAAAITDGDSDFLRVGRNGVFFDRQGRDWDATVVRIVEHPISIRQAFWAPYKRLGKMIGEQVQKMAAAREKAAQEKAAASVAVSAAKLETPKPAPAAPFDIAKFAGIFAAIGLAIGAISTAVVSIVAGFLRLAWWQMPLAVVGIVLIVSVPSMILAWLKLRQRNLGPILDANGWAVNARVKINLLFGRSLTSLAKLPPGSERSLRDPYAKKRRVWPVVLIVVLILLAAAGYVLNRSGKLREWTGIGKEVPPPTTGAAESK